MDDDEFSAPDTVRDDDWDALERRVVMRVRLLAEVARRLARDGDDAVRLRLYARLVAPHLEALRAFCEGEKR